MLTRQSGSFNETIQRAHFDSSALADKAFYSTLLPGSWCSCKEIAVFQYLKATKGGYSNKDLPILLIIYGPQLKQICKQIMKIPETIKRRNFLKKFEVPGVTSGISLTSIPLVTEEGELDVTPSEDLMREHGMLSWILLINL